MKKTERYFMSLLVFILVLVIAFVLPTKVIAQTMATEPTEDSLPYFETNDEAASEQGNIIGEDKTKRDESV